MEKCDVPRLKLALLDPDLALKVDSELSDDDVIHILCLMRDYKSNLSLAENEERELWIEHIVDIVKDAMEHKKEAIRAGTALAIGKIFFTHCSKSSFFVQKFNFDFPRKIVDFFG